MTNQKENKMETKKYWIRFTLLTLLPILIGLTVGLLVVRFGHRNCVDKTSLEKCEQAFDTILTEKLVLGNYHRFGEELYSIPAAAESELERLEEELSGIRKYDKITMVDSILDASLWRMRSDFPKAKEIPAATDLLAAVTDYYKGKAIEMRWKIKSKLEGMVTEKQENEHIKSLELQLAEAQAEQREVTLSIEEKDKTIEDLRIQLYEKTGTLPPLPKPHICDHSACEKGIDAAVFAGKIEQLEGFVADLDELYGLTTNWFDGKLRDSLKGKKEEYLRLIEVLEDRLAIDSSW